LATAFNGKTEISNIFGTEIHVKEYKVSVDINIFGCLTENKIKINHGQTESIGGLHYEDARRPLAYLGLQLSIWQYRK
jgi:hypothetical protein